MAKAVILLDICEFPIIRFRTVEEKGITQHEITGEKNFIEAIRTLSPICIMIKYRTTRLNTAFMLKLMNRISYLGNDCEVFISRHNFNGVEYEILTEADEEKETLANIKLLDFISSRLNHESIVSERRETITGLVSQLTHQVRGNLANNIALINEYSKESNKFNLESVVNELMERNQIIDQHLKQIINQLDSIKSNA